MSVPADARARLAARQAALVSALTAGGPLPADFDGGRIRAAAAALARKRARSVARAWPVLAGAMGERFDERFTAYAEEMPLPRSGGPLADGRAFARWLAARGELPGAARPEVLGVDLQFRASPEGLVRRRGPALKAVFLVRPRRLLVAVQLPGLGARWFMLPPGR